MRRSAESTRRDGELPVLQGLRLLELLRREFEAILFEEQPVVLLILAGIDGAPAQRFSSQHRVNCPGVLRRLQPFRSWRHSREISEILP
jgi:hypothetical protein